MKNSYPVRVRAVAPEEPRRALWLVKWLLLVPHAVVLFFLWIGFAALSVVAFFAILFTRRYPRSIFEFNVGVLRWSWRVWFYGYYALGTDRYPPFTLADVPDYPAGLEVEYPEQLSRGLVLVKSWLLAVPHYLVLSFFSGGGLYVAGSGRDWTWAGGLIVLLTLFAAVTVTFTGRYPAPVFDFVIGMNRWCLRVLAYAALMTDEYPPFRLDQGGLEPEPEPPVPPDAPTGAAEVAASAETPPATTSAPAGGWTAGRVVLLALGSLAVLVGLVTGLGAAAVAAVDHGMRDDDGYLMSGLEHVESAGYAVTSEDLDIEVHHGSGAMPRRMMGTVRITARSADGMPLFIGIARSDEATDYLDGVEHTIVTDLVDDDGHLVPEYRDVAGDSPRTPPTAARIWAAQESGPGRLVLDWDPQGGDWTVVVMRADGSAGVSADLTAGATVPLLGWGTVVLLVVALLFALPGVALLVVAVHGAHRSRTREAS